jgi:hypothetical protein
MSIKEKNMKKLNLATRQLERPDRAAKRKPLRPGSLAVAVVALLAMGVASYSIAMGAEGRADDRPAKFGIRGRLRVRPESGLMPYLDILEVVE